MRFVSSFLPKEAMEVAVCSKYCLEAIVLTFLEDRLRSACYLGYRLDWGGTFAGSSASQRECLIWLVNGPIFFCDFDGGLITFNYEDRTAQLRTANRTDCSTASR